MPDVGQLSRQLSQKSSGGFNRPTPFKQMGQAFRTLGGGGLGAETVIRKKGQKLTQVGDIARRGVLEKKSRALEDINKQQADINRFVQEEQEQLQTARRYAQEDIDTYARQEMMKHQRALQALMDHKKKLQENLHDFMDEESVNRQMEGINNLISGVGSGISAIADAGGFANLRNRLLQRQGQLSIPGELGIDEFSRFGGTGRTGGFGEFGKFSRLGRLGGFPGFLGTKGLGD